MRKFFMIMTLAVSYIVASGVASAIGGATPECDPNCMLNGGVTGDDPVR